MSILRIERHDRAGIVLRRPNEATPDRHRAREVASPHGEGWTHEAVHRAIRLAAALVERLRVTDSDGLYHAVRKRVVVLNGALACMWDLGGGVTHSRRRGARAHHAT